MKTFDLELRITTFGSIVSWKVYLEDATDDSQKVTDWVPSPQGFLYKKLPNYTIQDDTLDVFASCHGITGGTLNCEVLINNLAAARKVIANVDDRTYIKESYES